ncbi:integrase core domain-containing protein [Streptomyces sp. NPDC005017]|uniref:integrase core domain-containing protein n=1 Tax=Streptomyces sp. NPDC005017 TaxID=3364706 RepID=UPI0036969F88
MHEDSQEGVAEALNGSSKAEPIEHQDPWRDTDHVEHAVAAWVGWYNTERLQSALGYGHRTALAPPRGGPCSRTAAPRWGRRHQGRGRRGPDGPRGGSARHRPGHRPRSVSEAR